MFSLLSIYYKTNASGHVLYVTILLCPNEHISKDILVNPISKTEEQHVVL